MAALVNQPSMAAGEIAPELYGRVDQELYYIGLRTCRNFIVRKEGGVWNRPGTTFTCESKTNAKRMRLVPFQFNEVQTYILEFGDSYMRVIMNGAEVTETASAISGATKANPCVVTQVAHGYSNGDDVYISGILGMVELNGRTFRIKNKTANTYELTDFDGNNINSTAYTTYGSVGTGARIYTLATPWTETAVINITDAQIISYAQSNDVLTVCHNGYKTQDITRTGHAAWTIADFPFSGGPFKDVNGGATTVYSSTFATTAITGAANNGAGLVRLTVTSSASFATGNIIDVFDVLGTTEANGTWTATVIDATHIDLQGSAYANAYVSGGTLNMSNAAGNTVTITASASLFTASMVGDLFYIEQNPTDQTKAWEAGKNISTREVRRAGAAYYRAETIVGSAALSAAVAGANCYVTANAHGFATGDYVFIDGVVGMTELNGQWYYVKKIDANRFYLMDTTNPSNYINSTGYTAYTSGGTAKKGKRTGGIKPFHTSGTLTDGDPGVAWTYLHSGFGIVKIATYSSGTSVTATIVASLPDNVLGASNTTKTWAFTAWSQTEGYPVDCIYNKQRFTFGGSVNQPDAMWMSKVGIRTDFSQSNPILDDEAITVRLATNSVNAIRHFIPLSELIVLTSSNEQLVSGANHDLLATQPPTARSQGSNGSSKMKPIIVGNTAVYVQDFGSSIYSMKYDLATDTFTGIDLTARSPHLFRNKSIIDWAYHRFPFSVIWTVHDDGALNGFTFMEEQKVYAWHRHDTDGTFESVATIREGKETATYFVVNRTINGVTKRYVERLNTRLYGADIRDANFVDCGLSYDGRNTAATTVTVSGGTLWNGTETLTLTASAGIFKSTDVGTSQIVFYYDDVDGEEVRLAFTITAYTSTTVVSAVASGSVPAELQTVARKDWEFARTVFQPLWHLTGKTVAVLADGNVVSGLTVASGKITLPDAAAVVHIGLGFTSDLETLDMAQPQGQSKAKPTNVSRVFITGQETRSMLIGTNGFDKVKEVKMRDWNQSTDIPMPADTKLFEAQTNTSWSRQGRVCIRNTDPLPLGINCITPEISLGS